MPDIAIIGGSGFDSLEAFAIAGTKSVPTPYGDPSADIRTGRLFDIDIGFLPRHGDRHQFAPHTVNYPANIFALRALGFKRILAITAVGGISAHCRPGCLVIPDQLIDYTWGRCHTYYDASFAENRFLAKHLDHVDFSYPFDAGMRHALCTAGSGGASIVSGGVYGVTQGPRFETAAEIRRMQADGVDIAGMTAMPEAALAREMSLPYAMISMVVNPAAGLGAAPISIAEIHQQIKATAHSTLRLLQSALPALHESAQDQHTEGIS